MDRRKELKLFALMAAVFAGFYFLPLGSPRFDGAVQEALAIVNQASGGQWGNVLLAAPGFPPFRDFRGWFV